MRRDWEPIWDEKAGWRVDFTIEGNRIRRRLGIRDRGLQAVARRAAKALYRDTWDRHLNAPLINGTPFYKAAEGYVADGGEARFLPKIVAHFGPHTCIEDIGETEIAEAAQAIYPGRAEDTHRRQVRVPIRSVIRWARGERRQRGTDNKLKRWLTPEEAERLITAAAELTLPNHTTPERYTLQKIAFLLGSGCRTGECFALEVQHWNAASRQALITGTHPGAGKTAAASRWVRLPERAVQLIGEVPDCGRMFRTAYGQPIQMRDHGGGQMQASFNRARVAAGLGPDVTPRTLRHTWATWFYAQTRDFAALMDLGGWEKADTANRYRKAAPDDLDERLLAHGWDFNRKSRPWIRSLVDDLGGISQSGGN